jgi:DNA processing protein
MVRQRLSLRQNERTWKSWKEWERCGQVALKSLMTLLQLKKELAFIEKYTIRPLFLTDPDYPQRLLNCYDSPVLLFYKGTADLNASQVLSIVGTRSNTEYGKGATEKLISELAGEGVLVVSGLAHGIDGIAHKAALNKGCPQ